MGHLRALRLTTVAPGPTTRALGLTKGSFVGHLGSDLQTKMEMSHCSTDLSRFNISISTLNAFF